MPQVKILLLVDVADFTGHLTAHERTLLSARVLAACHQSAAGLSWGYKLVNTLVAPRAFEAALHDACTSSLTGDVPLPFTPEEHVRCNCTMFEGLRRWLHEISQETFQCLLEKHLNKKGHRTSDTHQAVTWTIIEKHLHEMTMKWFEAVPDSIDAENLSPNAKSVSKSVLTSRTALLISAAPQNFQQLTEFWGAPQSLDTSVTLQSMSSAALANALMDKVSNSLTSKFEKAGVSLFWACSGAEPAVAKLHTSDIAMGDRLQIERRHKKTSQWVEGCVSSLSKENETAEIQLEDCNVKTYKLNELMQMMQKGKLQWASTAEVILQALDAMLKQCFCNGGVIDGTKLLHSTQQHEVDAALSAFLGSTTSLAGQDAVPNADSDMQAITCQLDSLIAPHDVAKFQQLAEESRKLKQAKKHARKERRHKQQSKPVDEAAVKLAEHRAKVAKQERELHRAKADQQKAEQAANKRKLLLQRDRLLRENPAPSSCDPDEVMSQRRPEPQDLPMEEVKVQVDPSISASKSLADAARARDSVLLGNIPAEHDEGLDFIAKCAEELVTTAATCLTRCSESAVESACSAGPSYRPCPSPSASRLTASPPGNKALAAPLPVVRQALQRVLLHSSDTFWAENPPPLDAMDKQCIKRRNILGLQLFLRLHILVATQGDIETERLTYPPIMIAVGSDWEGIEEFWSDLVNELPEIPIGGNDYFFNRLKPALVARVPKAIYFLARNCGVWTEDDLLLNPEGDGGAVVGDSCCPAPSGSRPAASAAPSLQPSVSRGSGGLAQPATSDNSSGDASGSTVPQSKPEQQASKAKLGNLLPKAPARKRDLTQRLGSGRQVKWNPKAAMLPKPKSGMAGKKKQHAKKTQTPPPKRIRASDLAASPSSNEDSDAIPGTASKAHREVTSAHQKPSRRQLAFGHIPIPTIQELDAEDSKDDDAQSLFAADTAGASAAVEEATTKPAASKGWLQNASRKAPLGRLASRQLSRRGSSMLPPPAALHPTQSSRLDQLISTLSPAKPSAAAAVSNTAAVRAVPNQAEGSFRTRPCTNSPQHSARTRGSPKSDPAFSPPQAAHSLRSPQRFSPVPSRMSPHATRATQLLSPDRPKSVRRALLSPARSKAMQNLLSPKRAKPAPHPTASALPKYAAEAAGLTAADAADASKDWSERRWGSRPGSATFSSAGPSDKPATQAGSTALPGAKRSAQATAPKSPFAAMANQPPVADDVPEGQLHELSPLRQASLGAESQSPSLSTAVPDAAQHSLVASGIAKGNQPGIAQPMRNAAVAPLTSQDKAPPAAADLLSVEANDAGTADVSGPPEADAEASAEAHAHAAQAASANKGLGININSSACDQAQPAAAAATATAEQTAAAEQTAVAAAGQSLLAKEQLQQATDAGASQLPKPASAFAGIADIPHPAEWQAPATSQQALQQQHTANSVAKASAQDAIQPKRHKLTKRKRIDPCMESQPLASGATDSIQLQPSDNPSNAGADDDACLAPAQNTAAACELGAEHITGALVGGSQDASLGIIPPSDDEAEVQSADLQQPSATAAERSMPAAREQECSPEPEVLQDADLLHTLQSGYAVMQRIAQQSSAQLPMFSSNEALPAADAHALPETAAPSCLAGLNRQSTATVCMPSDSSQAGNADSGRPDNTQGNAHSKRLAASLVPQSVAPEVVTAAHNAANPVLRDARPQAAAALGAVATTADKAESTGTAVAESAPQAAVVQLVPRAPDQNGSFRQRPGRKPRKSLGAEQPMLEPEAQPSAATAAAAVCTTRAAAKAAAKQAGHELRSGHIVLPPQAPDAAQPASPRAAEPVQEKLTGRATRASTRAQQAAASSVAAKTLQAPDARQPASPKAAEPVEERLTGRASRASNRAQHAAASPVAAKRAQQAALSPVAAKTRSKAAAQLAVDGGSSMQAAARSEAAANTAARDASGMQAAAESEAAAAPSKRSRTRSGVAVQAAAAKSTGKPRKRGCAEDPSIIAAAVQSEAAAALPEQAISQARGSRAAAATGGKPAQQVDAKPEEAVATAEPEGPSVAAGSSTQQPGRAKKLGCSKCRKAVNGCDKCRPKLQAGRQPPAQSALGGKQRPSKRSRAMLPAAWSVASHMTDNAAESVTDCEQQASPEPEQNAVAEPSSVQQQDSQAAPVNTQQAAATPHTAARAARAAARADAKAAHCATPLPDLPKSGRGRAGKRRCSDLLNEEALQSGAVAGERQCSESPGEQLPIKPMPGKGQPSRDHTARHAEAKPADNQSAVDAQNENNDGQAAAAAQPSEALPASAQPADEQTALDALHAESQAAAVAQPAESQALGVAQPAESQAAPAAQPADSQTALASHPADSQTDHALAEEPADSQTMHHEQQTDLQPAENAQPPDNQTAQHTQLNDRQAAAATEPLDDQPAPVPRSADSQVPAVAQPADGQKAQADHLNDSQAAAATEQTDGQPAAAMQSADSQPAPSAQAADSQTAQHTQLSDSQAAATAELVGVDHQPAPVPRSADSQARAVAQPAGPTEAASDQAQNQSTAQAVSAHLPCVSDEAEVSIATVSNSTASPSGRQLADSAEPTAATDALESNCSEEVPTSQSADAAAAAAAADTQADAAASSDVAAPPITQAATSSATAAKATAAVAEAAAVVAPDTVRRSGRSRRATQKAAELEGSFVAMARGVKPPSAHAEQSEQQPRLHTDSPASRGTKRAADQDWSDACEQPVPSASISAKKRRKQQSKQQNGPALRPSAASTADEEFTTEVVTHPDTARYLDGIPETKVRRRSTAAAANRAQEDISSRGLMQPLLQAVAAESGGDASLSLT